MSFSNSQGLKYYSLPVGVILPFAGINAYQKNWVLADGSELDRADYPELASCLGNLWGAPSVATKFKLPNLTPVVGGNEVGLYPACQAANTGSTSTGVIGDIKLDFTLTEANIPPFTTISSAGTITDLTESGRNCAEVDTTGATCNNGSIGADECLPFGNAMTQASLTTLTPAVFSHTATPTPFSQSYPLSSCKPDRYKLRYFIKVSY
jgi:hypothetical protein